MIPKLYSEQGFCTSESVTWCKYFIRKDCPETCGYAKVIRGNVWEGKLAQLVRQKEKK